jgi:hypothetical protein
MNDPRLDPDTAEQMLRGEPTGPPGLAELLAAASAELAAEDLNGEEAAVAAFRETRSHLHSRQPSTRRLLRPPLIGMKAALIGLLLILAGGVTVAATSQHLPGPLGNRHSHNTRTPATSQTVMTRTTPQAPWHHTPNQHAEHHDKYPQRTAHPKKHPHPTKKPKGKPPKGN